jgi:hypothetical protein
MYQAKTIFAYRALSGDLYALKYKWSKSHRLPVFKFTNTRLHFNVSQVVLLNLKYCGVAPKIGL